MLRADRSCIFCIPYLYSKHVCFHGAVCSPRLKIGRKRQEKMRQKKKRKKTGIRPAVGDDGIGDDLNENPAEPQSGADGC